jgi:hypothetical protein
MIECSVCLGEHDNEYHQSVRRVRKWLLNRVDILPVPAPVTREAPRQFGSGLADIHELRSPSAKRKAARK